MKRVSLTIEPENMKLLNSLKRGTYSDYINELLEFISTNGLTLDDIKEQHKFHNKYKAKIEGLENLLYSNPQAIQSNLVQEAKSFNKLVGVETEAIKPQEPEVVIVEPEVQEPEVQEELDMSLDAMGYDDYMKDAIMNAFEE